MPPYVASTQAYNESNNGSKSTLAIKQGNSPHQYGYLLGLNDNIVVCSIYYHWILAYKQMSIFDPPWLNGCYKLFY